MCRSLLFFVVVVFFVIFNAVLLLNMVTSRRFVHLTVVPRLTSSNFCTRAGNLALSLPKQNNIDWCTCDDSLSLLSVVHDSGIVNHYTRIRKKLPLTSFITAFVSLVTACVAIDKLSKYNIILP